MPTAPPTQGRFAEFSWLHFIEGVATDQHPDLLLFCFTS